MVFNGGGLQLEAARCEGTRLSEVLLVPGGKVCLWEGVSGWKTLRYGLDNITFQQLLQLSLLGVLPFVHRITEW